MSFSLPPLLCNFFSDDVMPFHFSSPFTPSDETGQLSYFNCSPGLCSWALWGCRCVFQFIFCNMTGHFITQLKYVCDVVQHIIKKAASDLAWPVLSAI